MAGVDIQLVWDINSWLSRCYTARGSSNGFSLVGHAKVKAHKSFLFTKSALALKINFYTFFAIFSHKRINI